MLLVWLEQDRPRARFIARHVMGRMLGWEVSFAASLEEFRSSPRPKVAYTRSPVEEAHHIPNSGYLSGMGVPAQSVTATGIGKSLLLFPTKDGHDLLAACFHLLALVDEHRTHPTDAHGRLKAEALTLVERKACDLPLVDHWALQLAADLQKRYPQLPLIQRVYRHHLTVDVDNGLKYAARSFTRAIGATAKELLGGRSGSAGQRWRVRAGMDADPYERYVEHLQEASTLSARTIAFILTQGEGRFDHAARIDHPLFRKMLGRLSPYAELGLHPSFESSRNKELTLQERDRLQKAAGIERIALSRQHFLRWSMPGTFRALADAGFTEDHSIGFSDRIGFRAGTCTPFPWYDLIADEATSLMMYPFAVMDSVFEQRGDDPAMAVQEMKRLCDAVREVKGTLVSVWHDRYISGHEAFAPWPAALMDLARYAST